MFRLFLPIQLLSKRTMAGQRKLTLLVLAMGDQGLRLWATNNACLFESGDCTQPSGRKACPSQGFIAVMNTVTKLGHVGLRQPTMESDSIARKVTVGTQGRNLEAGTDSEAFGEALLTISLLMASSG